MRGKFLKIFAGILAVCGLLVFLYNVNFLGGLTNAAARVILPVSGAVGNVKNSIVRWTAGILGPAKISEDNSRLSYELAKTIIDKAKMSSLETENELLKKSLAFKETSAKWTLLAKITGKNNLDDTETIIINKGTGDGIKKGQAVVYADGIFIGKVAKVLDKSSFVQLVTDSEISVATTVNNSDHTTGIVRGEGGLSLKMEMIPQNENVAEGDIIITSGLEAGIPRGLVLGTIDSVIKESRSPFQTAIIRSPVNFDNLDYVLVIGEK